MRGSRLAVAVCVLLAAGCGDNLKPQGLPDAAVVDAPQQEVGPPPGTGSIQFAESLDAASQGVFSDWFPLDSQRDVIAVINLPDTGAARVVKLQVLAPSGVPIRTIWRAFTTGPVEGASVTHPNTGAPMTVDSITATGGTARLQLEIPIAGTSITRFALVGTYRVGLTGEQDQPLGSGSFELRGAP